MPKSKVTKTDLSEGVSRTPVKVKTSTTPIAWLVIMGLCMILGLLWIVLFYIFNGRGIIPFMDALGYWNYAISFGLFIVGLIMTVWWK